MLPVLHPDAAGLMLVLKSCSLPFLRIVRLRLYDHSERSHETFTNLPTG